MFRLYGFFTQNSLKTLYALEEVGVEFEFQYVDLSKGEQRSEEFAKMTPVMRVPLLEHDGQYLFESGAICRYVANVADSPLYPADKMQRAQIDQWMDFFSCHLGRWLVTLYFDGVIRPRFDLGDSDEAAVAEATKFAHKQLGMLDGLLENADWIANDAYSIADLFAFAYIEQHRDIELSIDEYANVKAWFHRVESKPGIARARARLPV